MKKYILFSATHRCQPCRMLVSMLNKEVPNWGEVIEYVDVDNATEKQTETAKKLKIMSLPSFTNQDEILFKGFSTNIFNSIKDLCIEG